MKRRIAMILAAILLPLGILAIASPAKAAGPPVEVATNQGASSLCMNAYRGGTGSGTAVIGYNCGDPNDYFSYEGISEYCGAGTVTLTCPFNNTAFDRYYDGAEIIQVVDDNADLCVGSFSSNTSQAQLTGCQNQSGSGGGWSTIWVAQNFNGTGGLINVHWTNADNLSNQIAGVCENGYRGVIQLNNIGTNGNFSPGCQWLEVFS